MATERQDHEPNSFPPIPPGSGIKTKGWEAAVNDVRNLASAHRRFWDLWVIVYKKHLRRYAGYGGCPSVATVYNVLRDEYDAAQGRRPK